MASKTNNYDLNDEELVYMINENNDEAKDALYQKYSSMIHKEIKKVKNTAYALKIDYSDLIQEAMLGFSNAVNTYNEEEDAKFGTYATLCVRRKLLNFIEKHRTAKSHSLNSALSLDAEMIEKGGEYIHFLKEIDGREPLNNVIINEELSEVSEKMDKVLNEKERLILEYSVMGKKPDEIAEIMGISPKKVYNILYRARKKIKSE